LQALHAEPHRSWSVESLAAAVNMSRSQFAQRFKQHVGRGPIDYLTEWRMFEAARALTEDRSPLDEIARSSGYSSVAAFGKAFKQWNGESPGALRRSAQGKTPSR
jgi:AraC-like DNA-binding protein